MSINEDEGTPLLESVGADTVPETSGGSELHKRHGHRPCPRRQKLSDRLRQHVERLKRTQYAPLKSLAGAGMGLVITTVGGLSIAANIFPSGTSLYYPEVSAPLLVPACSWRCPKDHYTIDPNDRPRLEQCRPNATECLGMTRNAWI